MNGGTNIANSSINAGIAVSIPRESTIPFSDEFTGWVALYNVGSFRMTPDGSANAIQITNNSTASQDFTQDELFDGTVDAFILDAPYHIDALYDLSGNGYHITTASTGIVFGTSVYNGKRVLQIPKVNGAWFTGAPGLGGISAFLGYSEYEKATSAFANFDGFVTGNAFTTEAAYCIGNSNQPSLWAGGTFPNDFYQNLSNTISMDQSSLGGFSGARVLSGWKTTNTSSNNLVYCGDRSYSQRQWVGKVGNLALFVGDQTAQRDDAIKHFMSQYGFKTSLPTITNEDSHSQSGFSNPVTISGASIGTPSADRIVAVPFAYRTTINQVPTVTIGGVPATVVTQKSTADLHMFTGVAYALVPTGTTADIVFSSFSGVTANVWFEAQVYSITGASLTGAVSAGDNGANPHSMNLTVSDPGAAIISSATSALGGDDIVWSGVASRDVTRGTLINADQFATATGLLQGNSADMDVAFNGSAEYNVSASVAFPAV